MKGVREEELDAQQVWVLGGAGRGESSRSGGQPC